MSLDKIGNKLFLASHNAGKLNEFRLVLGNLPLEITSAIDIDLPDVEETADTFRGNALLKAQAGLKATGIPTIGDDSGICIEALGGKPGIHSARWSGPGRDFDFAMRRVEEEMADSDNSKAYFICVLALALPDESVEYFEGRAHGNISFPARGDDGFGYDPIFVPEGYSQTYAEIGQVRKGEISARTSAIKQLLNYCKMAA